MSSGVACVTTSGLDDGGGVRNGSKTGALGKDRTWCGVVLRADGRAGRAQGVW